MYNLYYQAQEEDVPRVHPLLEEFMYTARGYKTGVKLIKTCNRERGKREGDWEV